MDGRIVCTDADSDGNESQTPILLPGQAEGRDISPLRRFTRCDSPHSSRTSQPRPSSAATRYSITDRTAAVRNPKVARSPTILPPCSNASGIMTSVSMIRTAPAANARA